MGTQAAERGADAARFRILALDDHPHVLSSLERLLRPLGFDTNGFTNPLEALASLQNDPLDTDVVLLDVSMPEMNGMEVLGRVHDAAPGLPVVMLSGDDTAHTAVAAIHAGAFDYLTKPIQDPSHMALVLSRAADHGRLQRRNQELERRLEQATTTGFETLVGSSAPMRQLFETIARVAPTDVSVLIRGESGTGKELVARAIHNRSNRNSGPFVALNCAAIPDTLVDSELFGHRRGAFTGAVDNRAGAFERASAGTLFLDEIGDISLAAQRRLLRVLQEREVRPLGSDTPRSVNVRVIAATLVDLDEAVEGGAFRNDLYYRLNVVGVQVPALSERADDVPLLAAHFLDKHSKLMGREAPRLDVGAVHALCAYSWPGNVRELENVIQRLLALFPDDVIGEAAMPPSMIDPKSASMPAVRAVAAVADADELAWSEGLPFKEASKLAVRKFERAYLTRLLEKTNGNITQAAKLAGLDRSNFRRVLARNDIRRGGF